MAAQPRGQFFILCAVVQLSIAQHDWHLVISGVGVSERTLQAIKADLLTGGTSFPVERNATITRQSDTGVQLLHRAAIYP